MKQTMKKGFVIAGLILVSIFASCEKETEEILIEQNVVERIDLTEFINNYTKNKESSKGPIGIPEMQDLIDLPLGGEVVVGNTVLYKGPVGTHGFGNDITVPRLQFVTYNPLETPYYSDFSQTLVVSGDEEHGVVYMAAGKNNMPYPEESTFTYREWGTHLWEGTTTNSTYNWETDEVELGNNPDFNLDHVVGFLDNAPQFFETGNLLKGDYEVLSFGQESPDGTTFFIDDFGGGFSCKAGKRYYDIYNQSNTTNSSFVVGNVYYYPETKVKIVELIFDSGVHLDIIDYGEVVGTDYIAGNWWMEDSLNSGGSGFGALVNVNTLFWIHDWLLSVWPEQ